VVTIDRRKLAAPVFAQAAAFVVVLAIGGFTGHSAAAPAARTSPPPTSPAAQASPGASSSTPVAARGQGAKLTVKVVQQGTDGLTVSGSQVKVAQSASLATVAAGTLNAALEFAANIPAGAYQVCVKPPADWASTSKNTHMIDGYTCVAAEIGSVSSSVTFDLAPQTQAAQ
jgi:hypothetical protein